MNLVKNFKTVLDSEETRQKINGLANLIHAELIDFSKKEMADNPHLTHYQAFQRFTILVVAEERYRQHIEAVAQDYSTTNN